MDDSHSVVKIRDDLSYGPYTYHGWHTPKSFTITAIFSLSSQLIVIIHTQYPQSVSFTSSTIPSFSAFSLVLFCCPTLLSPSLSFFQAQGSPTQSLRIRVASFLCQNHHYYQHNHCHHTYARTPSQLCREIINVNVNTSKQLGFCTMNIDFSGTHFFFCSLVYLLSISASMYLMKNSRVYCIVKGASNIR